MQRIHHKIKRILFGALAAGLLLSACSNPNQAKPDDNTGKQPPAPSKPEEKNMLNFKVRALTLDNTSPGFRVYSSVQQVQVAVAKGKTTATKTAVIDAIKAKDPEMLGIGEFQLYKTNKATADIYSEYDAGLKNNASVFIGKNTYSKKISLILKSITAVKDGYRPVADYKDGKEIAVRVGLAEEQAAITRMFRDAIKDQVKMGANYEILYQLFANEKGTVLAYDRNFVDNGTIYIGKKAMRPTITLKPVAARTPRHNGYIYSGVTTLFPSEQHRAKPIVPKTQLTLDEELRDDTPMTEVMRLFEAKIRDTLDAVLDNDGITAHELEGRLSSKEYEYRRGLFTDKDGAVMAKPEDFKDGATIYVGKKLSRRIFVKIFNVKMKDMVASTKVAKQAVTYACPPSTTGYKPINKMTDPINMVVEVQDSESVDHTINVPAFVDYVRKVLAENHKTLFPDISKVGFFKKPTLEADSVEVAGTTADDKYIQDFTKNTTNEGTLYVGAQ